MKSSKAPEKDEIQKWKCKCFGFFILSSEAAYAGEILRGG